MEYRCQRCHHFWKSRKKEKPKICPNCKSPYWEKPSKKISKDFFITNNKLIEDLHHIIIIKSGGEKGIRDQGGIYNSIYKIWMYNLKHFDNPIKIGAFIFEELAKRHHFVDGNKRTAYCYAKSIMITMKCHLKIKYPQAVDFILQIAQYENPKTLEEIEDWISKNTVMIPKKVKIKTYLKDLLYDIQYGEKEVEEENDRKGTKNN